MTERVLRALGATDERYFLAYAEQMKDKNPKKIVLGRWFFGAAAMMLLIGSVLLFFPVSRQKGISKMQFTSYEEMVSKTYGEIDTHLSSLHFDGYDKVGYCAYLYHKHASDMLEASYLITLHQGTTRTEILYLPKTANYEVNLNDFIRKITNAEEPYTGVMEFGNIMIRYGQGNDRVFGEWHDETGYYKIVCYSNQRDIFETVLTDLLR